MRSLVLGAHFEMPKIQAGHSELGEASGSISFRVQGPAHKKCELGQMVPVWASLSSALHCRALLGEQKWGANEMKCILFSTQITLSLLNRLHRHYPVTLHNNCLRQASARIGNSPGHGGHTSPMTPTLCVVLSSVSQAANITLILSFPHPSLGQAGAAELTLTPCSPGSRPCHRAKLTLI